ncbi:DUF3891 family protein [Metabacillus malikii]|uniref:DUF3891 family protein n=1 Tax=Metabacillus malikii TaxID=1504265 RepID=A0ABT9ZA49_9BACI|nr:DUF3891 family protein [Metabacillus malikii]MDQ0229107.1 hypothetical protein [Metabacillus malikii]
MIVIKAGDYLKMTSQHDHANFSGELATHFADDWFIDCKRKESVIRAISEHDRAWIRLDDVPLWNDQTNLPYSFMDYPLFQKLAMYSRGIDEVEEMDPYAALLCSIHYTSFGHIRRSKQQDCIDYMNHELKRQTRLRTSLHNPDDAMLDRHYKLLQLCDELSLYVCLNKDGASKAEEHPWYVNGFETEINGQRFQAEWKSTSEIKITPFLFKEEFEIVFKTKYVATDMREKIGINAAYYCTNDTLKKLMVIR